MKFREAKDKDWEQISEIYIDHWKRHVSSNVIISLHNKFQNRNANYNFWVIENENKVLGWSACFRVFENPLRENYVADLCIYIKKIFLFMGLGSYIMNKTILELKMSEIKLVFGHIEPKNLISKKMAKRHGFTYSNIEYNNSIYYDKVELWLLELNN
jgi:L-amino acid N-acyltransferase YncA